MAAAKADLDREKEEGAAAQKKSEEAARILEQARLNTEKMYKDEEAKLKVAADAAALVKKNEQAHLNRQSNQLTHKNLSITIDDPNDTHVNPDTDDEDDMAASMSDLSGAKKKGLQEPAGINAGQSVTQPAGGCCVLF